MSIRKMQTSWPAVNLDENALSWHISRVGIEGKHINLEVLQQFLGIHAARLVAIECRHKPLPLLASELDIYPWHAFDPLDIHPDIFQEMTRQ